MIPGVADSAWFAVPGRTIVVSLAADVEVSGLLVYSGASRERATVEVVSSGPRFLGIGRIGLQGGALRIEADTGPIQRLDVGERGSIALRAGTLFL
jgi:hypothetical protein